MVLTLVFANLMWSITEPCMAYDYRCKVGQNRLDMTNAIILWKEGGAGLRRGGGSSCFKVLADIRSAYLVKVLNGCSLKGVAYGSRGASSRMSHAFFNLTATRHGS